MIICKIISDLGHLMITMQLKLMTKTNTFACYHLTRRYLTEQDRMVVNCTWSWVKNNSKLTNLMRGIMVNKGRIHGELSKFINISSNLIKSDNESMVQIGENGRLWKRTSRWFHWIKNHRIWIWFRGEIEDRSEMISPKLKIMKIPKISLKLNQITSLNWN